MKFRITVEALDPDPGNESMDYIADTAMLSIVVEAGSTFEALENWQEGQTQ